MRALNLLRGRSAASSLLPMLRALAAAALSAGLLAGCGMATFSQRDELMTAVDEFNDGIRWGAMDRSARYLPVELRKRFAERWASLEDELEIMDYEVQRLEINKGGKGPTTADVRVDVSWSLKRSGILERTVMQQHWEQRVGGWMVARQTRLKGAPLPLVIEPAAPSELRPAPTAAAAPESSATH